ncbi:amino acid adenylation domain-containing protein [Kitasatospora sp. NPDC051853]|uniref:amino acid adenylation domain-containing protein n=1 Tax=Kitasatospora sp. NPDC051853 TaxID=3364058 RepID=UPI0037B16193
MPDVRRTAADGYAAAYPRNSRLHTEFEQQVAARPDAAAVRYRDRTVSYAQLNAHADRLASRLTAAGVRPGTAVGVCGGRSPEAVAAFLGILKAGCAYVPLDEEQPPARLRAMAEDAGVHTAVLLPGSTRRVRGLRTVVEAGELERICPEPSLVPVPGGERGAPAATTECAYVMFTSGSTGRPKPVAIPHRGVLRLVRSDRELTPPGPQDRVLHAYGLSSDASTIEIWGALLGGACLVLMDREELLAPQAFAARLRAERVTVAYLTTSVFHLMARTDPAALGGLRFVSAGGEAMDAALAAAVVAACPGTTVVNFYGPTENTVVSTAHVLSGQAAGDGVGDGGAVPIGRPFGATSCHVLGPDRTPVAPGEEGELYVGGDGLALGYLGDPRLTAERFADLPAVEPGGRLYRTGDRVLLRADGLLEYRGRLDRQVKLRGHRIELDEVEARLRCHPEVGEAVAELVGQHLTAYLTPAAAGRRLPLAALRRYCAQWLPAQAVPVLIAREHFPVTGAGKVDRRRLLAESAAAPARGSQVPRPARAGNLADSVAEVWQVVLKVRPQAGDDFFLIGGDSLLAAEVVTRTLVALGLEAGLGSTLVRLLLERRTLAGFTAAVLGLCGSPVPAGPLHRHRDRDRDRDEDRERDEGREPDAASGPPPETDFAAETALGFELPPAEGPAPRPDDPSDVLLTGATGFVGAFLLERLLRATSARIHCPVRAVDPAHAERRVLAAMAGFGLEPGPADRDRLVCFPADLALPGLGLPEAHAAELAARLDLVLHNAAQVNFLYPYRSLRATNVDGTREVIRLAARRRVPVHLMSTVAVVAGFGTAGVAEVGEDLPLDHADRLTMGYAESKWVAEGLLRRAAELGLPTAVHRPYEVTGDRRRGVCNTDTAICSLFKTIAETGLAPDIALPMDFVPVDHLAEAVVHIATTRPADGRVYHLTNPRPAMLADVLERMRAAGCELTVLPYDRWVGELVRHVARHPTSPTAPFVSLCVDRGRHTDISVKEMYLAGTFPRLGRRNTEAALAGSGFSCPPVDTELLDRYLEYFFSSGYIQRPARRPVAAAPRTEAP